MSTTVLKFGVFLSSPASTLEQPATTFKHDMQLLEYLDELGYDQAWVSDEYASDLKDGTSTGLLIKSFANCMKRIEPGVCYTAHAHQENQLFDVAIACQNSPAGARLAGACGKKIISIDATTPGGFNTLAPVWEVYKRFALKNNQAVDRNNWSLVGPVHIAESREEAFENIKTGLQQWVTYIRDTLGISIVPVDTKDPATYLVDCGLAVIGTADDAIEQIRRLQTQSGGFGTFLQMRHNWANWEQTKKSYQLFASKVAPEFDDTK